MDAGDEEKLCNMIVEVFLELGKPFTVSELAFHLKEKKDSVQHALYNLKKTGLVAQRDDRWLMAGSPEDIDEDSSLKVSAKERDLDRMGMRSRPPERGTQEKVSSLTDQLGGLRMRSVSPERGAACPEKRVPSPEEKLQGRPVGQKEFSNAVVPVMDRSILSARPNVSTVGSSNMEIETRQTLQIALLSDPGVREVHENLMSILAFLASKSEGVEAKDVSQNCNLGKSKRNANPLLYFLEKKQLVRCEQVGTSHKKIWKIGAKQPSELEIIEMAAEKSGVKKEAIGSSVTARSGTELHLHNHYHQHTHQNLIQVGNNNTMSIPQELEKHKRVFEKTAEDEVE